MTRLEMPALPPNVMLSSPATDEIEIAALGRRWDAWIAEGRVRDRWMLRRMRWIAGVVVASLATWGLWAWAASPL
jgi:hypothetical protein